MTTRVRLRDNPTTVTLLWVIGVVTLAGSAAVAITLGPAGLSVGEVASIVIGHLGGTAADVTPIRDGIVWDLRLPRTLLAALCGAGLGLCGAIMQSLLRNPLADPFVLGISSGASTGAVLIVILGVGSGVIGLSSGAFIGAVISFALVLLLAHAAGGTPDRVILAGVAATQLFSALTSFIVITSADPEQTRGVMFWLLGSLGGADWLDVALCAAVVAVGLVVCLTHSRALDAFAFGEDAASSLGVNVWRVRVTLLLATALMTAVIVSVAGAIGFVGLVLPHAARALVGPSHRRLLPASALIGSIFLVWVDAVARTAIAPQELPAGVVTALVGVPAFAVILWRRKARP
ncbi:iron chelate uptake ABC transporter family permease subunit [Rhodococcus erythropolis]|jgi:iron complex transport system permease protein|uniref:FecCD family ABC transporter permease n=1 Tax=Rhodococcus TaxID=1827 RepID=UPI0002E9E156|nr:MULTISPECIES: iron chelate uptake ABC transporter family permease subunit [Rhodococcus]MCD2153788.1 iron chelate uptake ABC transporter family permease subunit [Rhodococcus cerastii]AGT90967.1 ABC transporter permease [Rhodococcus erythropolis CCM2595]MBF7737606.1 iron chelate uptake ABC transporter family permease subunit [Rhodococcus erythropolis]MCQ4124471.1 iron chelate uptake ABC transporter family permease subunit [Rhodococcus erythropolis]MCS4252681.1 iron complex transport system pe